LRKEEQEEKHKLTFRHEKVLFINSLDLAVKQMPLDSAALQKRYGRKI